MSAPVVIDIHRSGASRPPNDQVGPPRRGRYRYPGDVVRLTVAGLSLLAFVAMALAAPDSILTSRAVERFAARRPTGGIRLLAILVGVTLVVGAAGVITATIVRRRYRLTATLIAGGALAAGVHVLLDRVVGATTANGSLGSAAGFPNAIVLTATAAVVVGVEPWLPRTWQRGAWLLVGIVATVPAVVGALAATEVVLAVLTGAVVGLGVLVAFGVPDRRLDGMGVKAALRRLGIDTVEAERADVLAKASRPFVATTTRGEHLFVKVLGADQRVADLLYRAYRAVRLRGVGDVLPPADVLQAVEHEALVALLAKRNGVSVPNVVTVGAADDGSALMVMHAIDGEGMATLTAGSITDDLLRRTWRQVALLHDAGIAHRALHPVNIVVDRHGEPWLVDFGFSTITRNESARAIDRAELLAATAAIVGPARAVAAAVDTLGKDALAATVAYLQPLALSAGTRKGLTKAALTELRAATIAASGMEESEPAALERLRLRTIVMIAVAACAFYFLLPQLGDARESWRAFRSASLTWVPLIVAMSVATYVGAAVAMMGSVPERLRFWPTLLAQAASSFVNRVTPVSVGGMALNVRFLQKSGVDGAGAVAGVGLNGLAGVIVHSVLLVVFFTWSGSTLTASFALPSSGKVLLGVAVAGVATGLVLLTPAGRRRLVAPASRALRSSFSNLAIVARTPAKLALLLGGSATVTLGYITALAGAVWAVHGDVGFAAIGAVFLGARTLAAASPTPGNLGAMEAALAAALIGVGMGSGAAVSAVLGYRLVTFWLPVLPGWLAWQLVQRWGYV